VNPVLKYRGGKQREIPAFIDQVPQNFTRYFEPFLGGGSVFFHLEPRIAVLGDVNGKLITFYTQLRNQYPLMRRQLAALQQTYEENQALYEELKRLHPDQRCENRNEALYYALREEYNHPTGQYLDGTLYFFINKTAYSGMLRFNANGEYNVPFGRYRHFNTGVITQAHSRLLQNAAIFRADYLQLFNMAQAADFMFLDPPYDCTFNDYGNVQTADGFNEAAHRRLAADFRNLNCPALMVIGSTPLTEALYAPLVRGRYEKRYAVNIRNRFQSAATHMIVRNY
jgi:DNA adenine methylase